MMHLPRTELCLLARNLCDMPDDGRRKAFLEAALADPGDRQLVWSLFVRFADDSERAGSSTDPNDCAISLQGLAAWMPDNKSHEEHRTATIKPVFEYVRAVLPTVAMWVFWVGGVLMLTASLHIFIAGRSVVTERNNLGFELMRCKTSMEELRREVTAISEQKRSLEEQNDILRAYQVPSTMLGVFYAAYDPGDWMSPVCDGDKGMRYQRDMQDLIGKAVEECGHYFASEGQAELVYGEGNPWNDEIHPIDLVAEFEQFLCEFVGLLASDATLAEAMNHHHHGGGGVMPHPTWSKE